MDPITAAFDGCRFTEIEAGCAQMAPPWGVHMPRGAWPVILYTSQGAACNVSVNGRNERHLMRRNSACLMLRGVEHVVQDTQLSTPQPPLVALHESETVYSFRSLYQEQVPAANVTSSFYLGVTPAHGSHTQLFDALPDVLVIDFDEMPGWLLQAQQAIRDELTWQRAGFRSVATRHAELAVIGLLRHYIASHPDAVPRWALLGSQSRVAEALRAFHQDIARPWTLDLLADAAGTSRTRLIAAARQELGEGLFSYMTRHRMSEAARLLRETSFPIGKISRQVGYQSEAALSIAFKRNHGMQPRAYRSCRLQGQASDLQCLNPARSGQA